MAIEPITVQVTRKPNYPNPNLTVIIRDDGPFIFMHEPPGYRTVHIRLTDEQLENLRLRYIGYSDGHPIYENINQVFIENTPEDQL
jgi:hypothetical protein